MKMGYFSKSLGIIFFSAAGESTTAFLGVTFCKQKYLKKSMVNEWYYEKKTKNHQMNFNLMCVPNISETREYFKSIFEVRVLSVVVNGAFI